MRKFLLATLSAAVLGLSACASNQSNKETIVTISNKDKAIALINSIESGDQTVVGYVNAQKYTQHNLSVGDGLAGFGEILQALPEGSARVNVVRAFEEGDLSLHIPIIIFLVPRSALMCFDSKTD